MVVSKFRFALTVAAIALLFTGAVGARQGAVRAAAQVVDPAPVAYNAMVERYCVTCHNERLQTAGLSLQGRDLARIVEDKTVWERVARKVRTGAMPPSGAPRPDEATLNGFVLSIEAALDRASAANLNPGRPLVHRLNRVEYANAVRDLLALEIDPVALLPPDELSSGFD